MFYPRKIIQLCLPIGYSLIAGCSLFSNNNNGGTDYTTIPLPPQKLNASNAAMPAKPGRVKTQESSASLSSQSPQQPYQRIQEDRSNGTVTEIKVDNRDLPDYYIYPTNPQEGNGNNPNTISTPSWQINW